MAQKDFLTLFVEYNEEFESPRSFWWWSGAALVAATVRNNIYHNAGNDQVYCNIYVLLIADSASYRKGGPFPLVGSLVEELHHTKLYSGRASIQAILEKLSQDIGGKKGIPIRGGSALVLAEELASFFVEDKQLVPLITDIYRSRKNFSYDLRGNSFVIKDLCVSMLSASNETNLRDVYDKRAVYGGLLGRTFLVKPDERRPENSLLDLDLTRYDPKILIDALEEIKQLSGPVLFTADATARYNKWYKELYSSLLKTPDPSGIIGRIHTSVLKLSMVIAAANYTTIIDESHVEAAINQSINLKENYTMYAMGAGKSNQAGTGTLFLQELWNISCKNGNKLSRKNFLQDYWNQVSAEELDKLTMTLEQAGLIAIEVVGHELTYTMTDKCKEKFESKVKTKAKKAP